MKMYSALRAVVLALAPGITWAALLSPGLYRDEAGHSIYIGVERNAPDPAVNEYFDPNTQRTGELPKESHLKLQRGIREQARILATPNGALGVSCISPARLNRRRSS